MRNLVLWEKFDPNVQKLNCSSYRASNVSQRPDHPVKHKIHYTEKHKEKKKIISGWMEQTNRFLQQYLFYIRWCNIVWCVFSRIIDYLTHWKKVIFLRAEIIWFLCIINLECLFEMMWTFGFNDAFCGKLIFLGIEKKNFKFK